MTRAPSRQNTSTRPASRSARRSSSAASSAATTSPTAPSSVAIAALQDLVDKPLAALGVVDLYHTVGHSVLLVVPVALTGRAGLSAAVGWGSHLLLDALHIVMNGRPTDALFLGWPLVVPPDPLALPPGEFFVYHLWSPSFFLEFLVWGALAVVLARKYSGADG